MLGSEVSGGQREFVENCVAKCRGKVWGGGDFPVGNVPDKTLARNFRIPMQN